MRKFMLLAALLSGCLHHAHDRIDGAVLGRVVIYRNGVAFYERRATVIDGQLAVHVPRDRVDDFLKSLTVVDPVTRAPLSVSIPRKEADDGSYLTMTIETADRKRADVLLTYVTESPAWKPSYRVVVGPNGKVMLESWAIVDNVSGEDWKGVLVGVGASSALAFRYDLWSVRRIDRDLLQGEDRFAIAPPTGVSPYAEGGEELVALEGDEVRASQNDGRGIKISGETKLENKYVVDGKPAEPSKATNAIAGVVTDKKTGAALPGVTVVVSQNGENLPSAITDENGSYNVPAMPGDYKVSMFYADSTAEVPNVRVTANKTTSLNNRIDTGTASSEVIRVAGSAPTVHPSSTTQGVTITQDYTSSIPTARTFEATLGAAAGAAHEAADSAADAPPPPPPPAKQGDAKLHDAALRIMQAHKDIVIETHALDQLDAAKRAQAVRDRLVDEGIPAAKIHVVPKIGANEVARVRLLAIAPGAKVEPTAPPTARTHAQGGDDPVGESHFIADRPMNVRAGTSAMVAMVHGETTGGVVYLYDPISDRGDKRFAFKAVRLDNPTDDTLEPGPVTVYGDGRFIGEGITEPVPPKASVVVPFALDKQIVVERHETDSDRIAKLITAQRGIVTAELQHRRRTELTITSRLATPAKIYLRHRIEAGWTVTDAPPRTMRVGDSQLYEVDLGPAESRHVVIAEATPIEKTFDLGSDAALGMMQVYIDDPEATPQLKEAIGAVLATHRDGADLADKIETLRAELVELRTRAGELHAQLVTLKLVRTSGDLMNALRGKLRDTQERMQKTTLAIVDTQEKLMLARVKLQNQLAELHLGDARVMARH